MTDDLFAQAASNAPSAGAGGLIGLALAAIVGNFKYASPKDIELAKGEMRAEMADKYARKDDLANINETLLHIRQRVDQIADRKL